MINLNEVISWTNGQVLLEGNSEFDGIGTDTRGGLKHKLFIALRGENFDAHQFLEKALHQETYGILIDKLEFYQQLVENNKIQAFKKANVSIVLVDDTLKGLQNLAAHYRRKMGTKIIAITGSNGKTTSKEFTAQVLKSHFHIHYNVGSFNNHWGVPISLLQLKEEHQVAVIEMGMDHYHEIENLVKIADPDIVVCTMVGNAHIENFGSLENISKAKEEIYIFAKAEAIRIFNLDNEYTKKMFDKYNLHGRAITFSESSISSEVCLKVKESHIDFLSIQGTILGVENQIKVGVFGVQNITNIMVAASVGVALGLSADVIWNSLTHIKTNWGRNQFVSSDRGCKILFDGYNANFDSMTSLLKNFSQLRTSGVKVAVLAEMLAIGDKTNDFHQRIGALAVVCGFREIIFYGKPWQAFLEGVKRAVNEMKVEVNCLATQ
ncbi:MAG: UDP-N-acetylmuramoyl-tripeptide--D-alanyl-D-alanine ligase, partial [Bdellovibrionaceae bacterium]|nr:UDP-N-acetylmuramoyl-tripeptide--D-alanyl-D-alanine ligase [Pseudobdellovibrionaceae bacterium]